MSLIATLKAGNSLVMRVLCFLLGEATVLGFDEALETSARPHVTSRFSKRHSKRHSTRLRADVLHGHDLCSALPRAHFMLFYARQKATAPWWLSLYLSLSRYVYLL